MHPSDIPRDYYSFQQYNSKHRWLTYWYQIREVLAFNPATVLEIGVGTGLVNSYLRSVGIKVETLDINKQLKPDHVGSVLNLDTILKPKSFDVVLCARVLHHLPYASLEAALRQIARISIKGAIVTLPVEDFRLYLMSRYTASAIKTVSIPLPLPLKRMMVDVLSAGGNREKFVSGVWKINDSKESSIAKVTNIMNRTFSCSNSYFIPEDSAHRVFILKNRNEQ